MKSDTWIGVSVLIKGAMDSGKEIQYEQKKEYQKNSCDAHDGTYDDIIYADHERFC